MPVLLNQIMSNVTDILAFITLLVYILVLIVIAKNRKDEILKHSFFSLMISLSTADILKILFTTFWTKLAGYGWVSQLFILMGGWTSRLGLSLGFCFEGAQVAGVLFITVNRFTATVFPLKHAKIWVDGTVLRNIIFVQWAFALAVACPIIFSTKLFSSNIGTNNGITFQWDGAQVYNTWITLLVFEPLIILIVGLYIVIFTITFRKKTANGRTKNEKIILRMSLIGVIHTLGIIIQTTTVVSSLFAWIQFRKNLFEPTTFWFLINEGNAFFCTVNPYALLIFCSPVRIKFLEMFKKKKTHNHINPA